VDNIRVNAGGAGSGGQGGSVNTAAGASGNNGNNGNAGSGTSFGAGGAGAGGGAGGSAIPTAGDGANGGSGGDANMMILSRLSTISVASGGAFGVLGGKGGNGGSDGSGGTTYGLAGNGGEGGETHLTIKDSVRIETNASAISLAGGDGGDGGVSGNAAHGNAGGGGGARMTLEHDVKIAGTGGSSFTVAGGNGGDASSNVSAVQGSQGGNGGSATLEITGSGAGIETDGTISLAGGAGGIDQGSHRVTGDGGDVDVTVSPGANGFSLNSTAGNIALAGGAGGGGAAVNGTSGAGGDVTVNASASDSLSLDAFGSITLTGGAGGVGANAAGGDVSIAARDSAEFVTGASGVITLTGGAGGAGTATEGGDAALAVRDNARIETDAITLAGGDGGTGQSATGGDVSLTAQNAAGIVTRSASGITLTGGDGGTGVMAEGGNAALTVGDDAQIETAAITLSGGVANTGTNAYGGNAALTAGGGAQITVDGDLKVLSGERGSVTPSGSDATLTIGDASGDRSTLTVSGDIEVSDTAGNVTADMGNALLDVRNAAMESHGDLRIYSAPLTTGNASTASADLTDSSLKIDGALDIASATGTGSGAATLNAVSTAPGENAVEIGTDATLTARAGEVEMNLANTALTVGWNGGGDLTLTAGTATSAYAALNAVASPILVSGDIRLDGGSGTGATATLTADADSPVTVLGDITVTSQSEAATFQLDHSLTLAGDRPRLTPQTILASRAGTAVPTVEIARIDAFEHTKVDSDNAANIFRIGDPSNPDVAINLYNDKDFLIMNSMTDIQVLGSLTVHGKGRIYVDNPTRSGVTQMVLNAQNSDISIITQASVGSFETTGTPVLEVQSANLLNANISVDDEPNNGRIQITRDEHVRLVQTAGIMRASTHYYRTQTTLGDSFSINVRNNNADLMLMGAETKAYTEAGAASLLFLGQGADFVLNRGIASALKAAAGAGNGVGAFSDLSYGQYRHETGSHVKVKGGTLIAGLAQSNALENNGRLTFGAFFEGGWGNYDTYNSFAQTPAVDGDGKARYYGLGALARYDDSSGFYADAALRAGQSRTDFVSSDIRYTVVNAGLGKARFKTDATYHSVIAGGGYRFDLTDATALDLSGHVLWTHQSANAAHIYFDRLRFNAADSLRTRLGGRITHALDDRMSLYTGAYWDREYKGETQARLNGLKIYDAATLRGNVGVIEAGALIRPEGTSNFSLDAGIQGYTGKRDGAAASLRFKWLF
jgi:hypothetical protein